MVLIVMLWQNKEIEYKEYKATKSLLCHVLNTTESATPDEMMYTSSPTHLSSQDMFTSFRALHKVILPISHTLECIDRHSVFMHE
jgi:hypothetical protein